ncbi:MAG: ElyC/SanA/YdcF family protein [Pseudomonadota bacterium]
MKLFARRSVLGPTLAGWLMILLVTGSLFTVFVRGVGHFLAVDAPLGRGVVVVEGWLSQTQLKQVASHLEASSYDVVLTSGGPIKDWYTNHPTYADRTADELMKMGIPARAVPSPASAQNRTFLDAVIVRNWLQERGISVTSLDVVTGSTHARRSRHLYRLAFPNEVDIGVAAIAPDNYSVENWWTTSDGAKGVGIEFIGWVRVTCCFFPPEPGSHEEMWGVYDTGDLTRTSTSER